MSIYRNNKIRLYWTWDFKLATRKTYFTPWAFLKLSEAVIYVSTNHFDLQKACFLELGLISGRMWGESK